MRHNISDSANLALIVGAGRTGRGLLAPLAVHGGWRVGAVDRDADLIAAVQRAGGYPLERLGAGRERVDLVGAWTVDGDWDAELAQARLVFVSVGGNALPAVGAALAPRLRRRRAAGGGHLDLIVAENRSQAARVLAEAILAADPAALDGVGVVEAMVLTTSLSPEAGEDPLLVRSQDALRLPCDAAAFIAGPPALPGLEPLPAFAHQLQRKLATYNGINAVISYLGAERGHVRLADAANDLEIAPWAQAAGDEAGAALVAEFGFDVAEQAAWRESALAKFADPAIPDPIARNADDVTRKLRADDRLLYPALLALAHGIAPRALARGIAAALRYREGGTTLLERHGCAAAALAATAGLADDHPLHALVAAHV